jgi:glutamyl/glutaminyl-tRNA synthetase
MTKLKHDEIKDTIIEMLKGTPMITTSLEAKVVTYKKICPRRTFYRCFKELKKMHIIEKDGERVYYVCKPVQSQIIEWILEKMDNSKERKFALEKLWMIYPEKISSSDMKNVAKKIENIISNIKRLDLEENEKIIFLKILTSLLKEDHDISIPNKFIKLIKQNLIKLKDKKNEKFASISFLLECLRKNKIKDTEKDEILKAIFNSILPSESDVSGLEDPYNIIHFFTKEKTQKMDNLTYIDKLLKTAKTTKERTWCSKIIEELIAR